MLPDIGRHLNKLPELLETGLGHLSPDTKAELGAALAGVAATTDPLPLATFVLSSGCVGIIQERSVKVGGDLEQQLLERIEALEDEESRTAALQVALLRRFTRALPDGDELESAVIQTANGDPTDLIELFEAYSTDAERRRRYETTVRNFFDGDVELAEDETFVDHLTDQFETDDPDEALTTFLDVSDLLTAEQVHDAVGQLADIQVDLEAVEAAVSGGREEINRLLDQDLRSEGFHRVSDAYVRTLRSKTATEAWQTGMNLRQVIEREYAVERPVVLTSDPAEDWAPHCPDDERLAPGAVADGLATGANLLVQGKPGSGKSVICRLVIDAWRQADRGTVLYRPSGEAPFTDPGPLEAAIEGADGPVLVVVEDAARAEAKGLYTILNYFYSDDSVAFLLNARFGEWNDFDPAESTESDMDRQLNPLLESLPKATPASLDTAECVRIVERFEELTDREMPLQGDDPAELGALLHERIRTESQAGEMLHLTFLLADGEGLRSDAVAKAAAIEWPEDADDRTGLGQFDRELVRHVGLMVALLNAAEEQTLRREYLFALATELSAAPRIEGTYSEGDVADLLERAFDGWLVFDGNERRRYRTYHPSWSFLFLRELLHNEAVGASTYTVHERFARCLRAALRLLTDPSDARGARIRGRVADLERTVFDDLEAAPERTVVDFVEDIHELGVQYPILAPMYQSSDHSVLALEAFEGIPTEAVARARVATGRMYSKRGEIDTAREELERCGGLLAATDGSHPELEAERRRRLASVSRTEGRLDEAESTFRYIYDQLSRSATDRDAMLSGLCREIGGVRLDRNDFDGAQKWYDRSQAYDIDPMARADALNALGGVAENRGDHGDAEDLHRDALEIYRDIGSQGRRAAALTNLGNVESSRGNLDEAERLHRDSLAIDERIGNRIGQAVSLMNLGTIESKRGHLDAAEKLYKDSLEIKQDAGDQARVARTYYNLGLLKEDQDDLSGAIEDFERSAGMRADIGAVTDALTSLSNLYRVAKETDDTDRAVEARTWAIDLVRESDIDVLRAADLGWLVDWTWDRLDAGVDQPARRVREAHLLGCQLLLNGEYEDATRMEAFAWDQREAFETGSDTYAIALAAGTGAFGLLRYREDQDADEWVSRVLDPIRSAEVGLPQGAAVLLERLGTGATDTTPDDLRSFAETDTLAELERREALAFAELLDALE